MPRKVDAGRRCADLLAALARTANVTLACRETGVSKFWAYRRRGRDADFARRWATAVRAGERRAACAAARLAARPIGEPGRAGDGLIVQGRAGTGTRRLQRPARDSFGPERRAAFLQALRATCNVRAARLAAGVGSGTIYRHYHEDAAFREAWREALAEGRMHLEMAMIGAGRALFDGDWFGGGEDAAAPGGEGAVSAVGKAAVAAGDIAGMDAKTALQLLRLHRPVDAGGRRRGRGVKPADADATRREILAKVAAVRAARGGGVAEDERDAGSGAE